MNTHHAVGHRAMLLLLLLLPCLTSTVCAQRLPVPDSDGRVLQLFDLAPAKLHEGNMGQQVADMLRPFVTPALDNNDDLRPLGQRWLAMLGSPEQIACVDRLFQYTRAHADDLVSLNVFFFEVEAAAFHNHLEPLLHPDAQPAPTNQQRCEVVLAKQHAPALLAAGKKHGEVVTMPSIVVRSLHPAEIAVLRQIGYIKDYLIARAQTEMVADPVVDTVWSGQQSNVCAVLLPNGNIGITCDIQHQQVDEPLAEVELTVVPGTAPVKVQLPRVRGLRLTSVAELAPGSMMVIAAQRSDGSYMIAAVSAAIMPG